MDNATYVLVMALIVLVGALQPILMAYLLSDTSDVTSKAGRYSDLCSA
jgi:hypothetical protein